MTTIPGIAAGLAVPTVAVAVVDAGDAKSLIKELAAKVAPKEAPKEEAKAEPETPAEESAKVE